MDRLHIVKIALWELGVWGIPWAIQYDVWDLRSFLQAYLHGAQGPEEVATPRAFG